MIKIQSPVILQKMTDAIKHRGPDGEGHWIDENIGLGHRRLSIIDPSPSGRQPMESHDHRFISLTTENYISKNLNLN